MKKILLLLSLVFMISLALVSCKGVDYYKVIYNVPFGKDYAEVVKCIGNPTDIVIDSEYNGMPVTKILNNAFSGCDTLNSVIIPDSVTSIGNEAFVNCNNLSFVKIGDGVVTIGRHVFANCINLISVEMGNNVISIGSSAFARCHNLMSIVMPNTLNDIGSAAFTDCTSLSVVVIPDKVTSIGDWTFSGCSRLSSVVIGNSVDTIGDYAFENCSSLNSLVIPCGVTSIGRYAFAGCNVIGTLLVPESLISIGVGALDDLNIAYNEYENCKYIGTTENPYFALIDAISSNTINLKIHSDTKVIAEFAFQNCEFKSIEIPSGVRSIGVGAFNDCCNLTEIIVDENNENYKTLDGNLYTKDGTTLFCYAIGKLDEEFHIPAGVSSIEKYAFMYCEKLKTVVFSDSVINIGSDAFSDCINIECVIISDSVKIIGESAFENCSNLNFVVIGSGVTNIEDRAFLFCNKLRTVYYTGSEKQWEDIIIDTNNHASFKNITVQYNYIHNK